MSVFSLCASLAAWQPGPRRWRRTETPITADFLRDALGRSLLAAKCGGGARSAAHLSAYMTWCSSWRLSWSAGARDAEERRRDARRGHGTVLGGDATLPTALFVVAARVVWPRSSSMEASFSCAWLGPLSPWCGGLATAGGHVAAAGLQAVRTPVSTDGCIGADGRQRSPGAVRLGSPRASWCVLVFSVQAPPGAG